MPEPISLDEIIMDAYKTYKPEELEEYKPTNYDRIKAMNVEELAKVIMCPYAMGDDCEEFAKMNGSNCNECCEKWLQSEAEEPHD